VPIVGTRSDTGTVCRIGHRVRVADVSVYHPEQCDAKSASFLPLGHGQECKAGCFTCRFVALP
jgi:hypothetical protein